MGYKYALLGAVYSGDNCDFFVECIESLKAQTKRIDCFLVVDGPIGEELEQLLKVNIELFTKVIRLTKNRGLSKALNEGLASMCGHYDYAIRFDADDINHPSRVERLIDFIEVESPDLCCSTIIEFDGDFRCKRSIEEGISKNQLRAFILKNPIYHPACAFNIQSLATIGFYQDMPGFEDWLTWLILAKNGYKIAYLNDPLVSFRVNNEMMGRRFGWDYFAKELAFYKKRREGGFFSLYWDVLFIVSRFCRNVAGRSIFMWLFRSRR